MADHMAQGKHECALKVDQQLRVRPDLSSVVLSGGKWLFTDGCCWRKPDGGLAAAAAVVESKDGVFVPVGAEKLLVAPSAQAAEVLAMCLALENSAGQVVNVYSDSAYAVSAALLDLAGWLKNGFMTTKGTPIAHKDLMMRLHQALLLPSAVSIIKVPGHCKSDSITARGNDPADALAKATAGYKATAFVVLDPSMDSQMDAEQLEIHHVINEQAMASPEEKSLWLATGCKRLENDLWVGKSGRPVLCLYFYFIL